jgi:co-chaperonin GroES (HSP10)
MSQPLGKVCSDLIECKKAAVSKSAPFSARSAIWAPVMVDVLAGQDQDKAFFGDVTQAGVAPEQYGQRNAMACKPGDTIICNNNSISYRVTERGVNLYLIRNAMICALLDPETFKVKPAQHYILVKQNEARALELANGVGSRIWVPTTEMETDDEASRFNVGLSAAYGEVVEVGPGRWEEGQWLQAQCVPGDMVLYDASHSTLPVTVRGQAFTLVAAGQLAKIYPLAESLLERGDVDTWGFGPDLQGPDVRH